VTFDLTEIDKIPKLINDIEPIDILINNAGIMHSLPFDQYPEEKKQSMLKINIEAPAALIRQVTPHMRKKGKGRIVNVASIAGEIGHPDIWYGITKAGMINLTKSMAKILGPDGIVVNAVAPGPTETSLLATIPQARKEQIKNTVFTGRFAQPQEVAQTIYWLATDCPEYINGICVDINNGAFMR
jgi:3-oxoacyl-[acyl-carrier protein] reductase